MKNISEFAKTPELLEITIDDPEIVKTYGEPVTFYMKDFVDINTYFDFFRSQSEGKEELNLILKKLVLDKNGLPALKAEEVLPVDLVIAVLNKINENLGKSNLKSSTKKTGNQPN